MTRLPPISRPLKHIGFWLALYSVNLLFWGTSLKELEFALIVNLFFSVFRLPLSYFNLYYLIPRHLQQRKFLQYLLYLTLLLAVQSVLFRYAVGYYWEPMLKPVNQLDQELSLSIFSQLKQFLIEFYVQGIVMSVKLGQDWLKAGQRNMELEEKQIAMELGMLKSQIQPHFFFNTLNSLYALCLQQPKRAANSILGLSEVMDYILYRANKTHVLLQQEMEVVDKYIALERLRFDERLKVNSVISEAAMKCVIPPIIILSLIENAFKHGLHEVNSTAILNIDIGLKNDSRLSIEISNTIPKGTIRHDSNRIGLQNLNRRLELLYEQHELLTRSSDGTFTVTLNLPANAH